MKRTVKTPEEIENENLLNKRRTYINNWLDMYNFTPDMIICRKGYDDNRKRGIAIRNISFKIQKNIDKDYGVCDKPPDMDIYEYWLSRLDFDDLKDNNFN
jgi:hypothetical protein